MLKTDILDAALAGIGQFENDPLCIIPFLDAPSKKRNGSVSIDLRLGRWFVSLKETNHHIVPILDDGEVWNESEFTRREFIRYGSKFVLHPGHFVLAATLEWIRMPEQCCGHVVGKSSLGRRGLIIETAPTVHPGFSGCLTLEVTNVGRVPLELMPSMFICQLLVDWAEGEGKSDSNFFGLRRPVLGKFALDKIATQIQKRNKE